MRVYLVVIDESEAARKALRYASRRAAATGGAVHILALVPQQGFNAFGGVQATIEREARDRAEAIAHGAAGNLFAESGIMPTIAVRVGEAEALIREYVAETENIAVLVLGADAEGTPGPLVSHFSAHPGALPCPITIIPGSIGIEDVDRLTE